MALFIGIMPSYSQHHPSLISSYYELVGVVAAVGPANTILGIFNDDGCILVATWFSLFISSCQPGTFFAVMCLLACFVK